MALPKFDSPLYVRRKFFIQEIAGLDEAFDLLDEWPSDKRNIAYEVMISACRKAANGLFPAAVIEENLRRFLRQNGMLADAKDIPRQLRKDGGRNASGA